MIKYRNCPICDAEIKYITEYGYTKAIELNSKCSNCAHLFRPKIQQYDRKYSCKCINCSTVFLFAYETQFKKIDKNAFKCKKCKYLTEKECLVCGKNK